MAKSELGTKRIDPETGRKFYDLNNDPIVSPYTGKSYPRSYFDSGNEKSICGHETRGQSNFANKSVLRESVLVRLIV